MNDIRRESQSEEETFPAHEEIEERAYQIYLELGCEEGHALEHWFRAEEQLIREHRVAARHLRGAAIIVAPNGTAETTPERDAAIVEEEMAQVRASEELKEEGPAPRRARTSSVGQRRSQ